MGARMRSACCSPCPRIGAHAPHLARLCGYLPLALRVSAALLASTPSRRVERYLQQLEADRLDHLRAPGDPAASVEGVLALSYTALPKRARRCLDQLSVFPSSFDLTAAEAVVVDVGEVEELLELLQQRSLLEWVEASERYDLHDLVREFAAARLADADAVRFRHARHYAGIAEEADTRYDCGGEQIRAALALFDRERVHIDAGWEWARARAGREEADRLVLAYANATAHIGDLRYDTRRERVPQLQAALAAAQRLGDRRGEAMESWNLGLAYEQLGDRRGEAMGSWNLGLAYEQLGDVARAVEAMQLRVDYEREIGHPDAERHAARVEELHQRLGDTGEHAAP